MSTFCLRASDEIRLLGPIGLARAAIEVAQLWSNKDARQTETGGIVIRNLAGIAAEGANQIYSKIQGLGQDLSRALAAAATALGVDVPTEEDLTAVVKEMPRLDPDRWKSLFIETFLLCSGRRL